MAAGAPGPSGGVPGQMMNIPAASSGLTPAQPWTGTMPWQQGQASDGGVIGGTPMQKHDLLLNFNYGSSGP